MELKEEEKTPLHKTVECVKCQYVLDCKGKPRTVDRCINFKERAKDK